MQCIGWLRIAGEELLFFLYPGGKVRRRPDRKRLSKRDWKRAARRIDEREKATKKGSGDQTGTRINNNAAATKPPHV